MNDRLMKCTRFTLSRNARGTGIFLIIYAVSYLLILILLYSLASVNSGESNTNMNLCIPAAFYLFIATAVTYGGHFNSLLMFGNTRRAILGSFFLSSAAISLGLAVLSLLSDPLNLALSYVFHFKTNSFLDMAYGASNVFEKLFFFFALLFLISCLALLYAAFSYRFGRWFRILFWVIFGFCLMLPTCYAGHSLHRIMQLIQWYFGYDADNGILRCSLHMFGTAALAGIGTFLLARRQPQNI